VTVVEAHGGTLWRDLHERRLDAMLAADRLRLCQSAIPRSGRRSGGFVLVLASAPACRPGPLAAHMLRGETDHGHGPP